MHINENAPVLYRGFIEIDASAETVWNILSDFESWPRWNPDIESVKLKGRFGEGAKFSWKTGPGTIRSKLEEIKPQEKLAWAGKTFGIKAIHIWKIEQTDGGTVVTTEESWDGLHVSVFRKYFGRMLKNSIDNGLKYLRKEAEKTGST